MRSLLKIHIIINKDLELHEYSKQIEVNRTINNDRYRKPFDDRLYTIAIFSKRLLCFKI